MYYYFASIASNEYKCDYLEQPYKTIQMILHPSKKINLKKDVTPFSTTDVDNLCPQEEASVSYVVVKLEPQLEVEHLAAVDDDVVDGSVSSVLPGGSEEGGGAVVGVLHHRPRANVMPGAGAGRDGGDAVPVRERPQWPRRRRETSPGPS